MSDAINGASKSSTSAFKVDSHTMNSVKEGETLSQKRDSYVAGVRDALDLMMLSARGIFTPSIPIQMVKREVINAHIAELSDDKLKGRDSPSHGLDRAANYIIGVVKKYGLKGISTGRDEAKFLQPFDLYRQNTNFEKFPISRDYGVDLFEFAIHGIELARLQSMAGKKLDGDYRSLGQSNNIVALLEGSDPELKDEYVIVSAHYDHLGEKTWGSDKIYNGADDNASGSAALLGILPALAELKSKGRGPKRSILFIWTAAEEKGLIGADYYSKNPLHPMKKTVAAINVDMIARESLGQISVCTKERDGSQNFFREYASAIGKDLGFTSVDHDIDPYLRRQDGWIWTRAGIPTIFLFEGFDEDGRLNPDYHGVDDEMDKILKENGGAKAERTARMALLLLMKVAEGK